MFFCTHASSMQFIGFSNNWVLLHRNKKKLKSHIKTVWDSEGSNYSSKYSRLVCLWLTGSQWLSGKISLYQNVQITKELLTTCGTVFLKIVKDRSGFYVPSEIYVYLRHKLKRCNLSLRIVAVYVWEKGHTFFVNGLTSMAPSRTEKWTCFRHVAFTLSLS